MTHTPATPSPDLDPSGPSPDLDPSGPSPDLDIDLSGLSQNDWLGRLDGLGDEHGGFDQLGSGHFALRIAAGSRLLVTFESIDVAQHQPGARPRGFDFVTGLGWSHLALFSDGETWFRDPAVWRYFDGLTDEGFFEGFAQVLFFGTGSAGYAAAAFAVASPGAQVLALRPQATLDPAVVGWDRRFLRHRRLDFNSRYGYAPDMLDAAGQACVVFDPGHAADATHAALFRRPNVTMLRAPLAGPRIESTLDAMQITPRLIEDAMAGDLTVTRFAQHWRARRGHMNYLRGLLKRAEIAGKPGLVRRICDQGLASRDQAFYRRKLQDLAGGEFPTADAAE